MPEGIMPESGEELQARGKSSPPPLCRLVCYLGDGKKSKKD
jgi:hypothetical protein